MPKQFSVSTSRSTWLPSMSTWTRPALAGTSKASRCARSQVTLELKPARTWAGTRVAAKTMLRSGTGDEPAQISKEPSSNSQSSPSVTMLLSSAQGPSEGPPLRQRHRRAVSRHDRDERVVARHQPADLVELGSGEVRIGLRPRDHLGGVPRRSASAALNRRLSFSIAPARVAIFARAESEMAPGRAGRSRSTSAPADDRIVDPVGEEGERVLGEREAARPGQHARPVGRLGTIPVRGIPQPGVVSGRRLFVVAPTNRLQIGTALPVTR